MKDLFLGTAARIGARLARQARWSGDACTWTVMSPDRQDPTGQRGIPSPASGSVYGGTAGIALFLAELHRLTGDAPLRAAAQGALRFALRDETLAASPFGYHGGRVGVASVAVRAARLLDDGGLRDAAQRLLAPLYGHEDQDVGEDVVAGAAGAIPALLAMRGQVDDRLAMEIPERLAERLMARAEREPRGWSWGDPRQMTNARNLAGVAHGAAGMGHGLLEMYAAGGDARHRYAAEQAFAYERQFYDPDERNWPDFRHKGVSEFIHRRLLDELRELLAARGVGALPYQRRFMMAWCHGAPGIALTRLRAYELLGTAVYRDEAEAGLQATRRALQAEPDNYSLCHGAMGNAEIVTQGARVLGLPALAEFAAGLAAEGCERFERAGRPWPCGTPGRATDPGLMLGEAGIGHALLRMHDPAIPAVLLVTAQPSAAGERPETRAAAARMAHDDAAAFFGRSLRLLDGTGARLVPAPDSPRTLEGTPAAVDRALADHVEAEDDGERGERLRDALRLERERFALWTRIDDFTREYLVSQLPPRSGEPEWDAVELALSPLTAVVHGAWDWDAVAHAGGSVDEPGAPAPEGACHLLFRRRNRMQTRPLTPLAGVVLHTLAEAPGTLEEVTARVAARLSGVDAAQIADPVREQLRSAWLTGLVDCAPAAVPA
jgi:hypothetical protein